MATLLPIHPNAVLPAVKGEILDHGTVAEYFDPTYGNTQWLDGYWYKGVPLHIVDGGNRWAGIRCRGSKRKVPEFLFANALLIYQQAETWWSPFETQIRTRLARKKEPWGSPLKVRDLTISIPNKSLQDGARWNLELVTESPFYVFLGRFDGLTCAKVSRLGVH